MRPFCAVCFFFCIVWLNQQLFAKTPVEGERHENWVAPQLDFQILETRPHDQAAFTQGLLYHQGYLFESTGLYGNSSLRRVDPASGEVLQKHELDSQYFGEGLALIEQHLYQLTWQEGVAFVYDLDSFQLVRQIHYSGEGWGLAFDGTYLIRSNGTAVLDFLQPDDFTIVRRLRVREGQRSIPQLNELCYVDGQLFANIFEDDRVARIDLTTGQVNGWLDFSGLLSPREKAQADVLNGIAHHPETGHFFITGKLWPKLFVIAIQESQDPSPQ